VIAVIVSEISSAHHVQDGETGKPGLPTSDVNSFEAIGCRETTAPEAVGVAIPQRT
jgi:hypothetical protein